MSAIKLDSGLDSGLDFKTLCQIAKGRLMGKPESEPLGGLLIDSRSYRSEPNSVFFALSGSVHNGHDHIDELMALGLKYFVVERKPIGRKPPGVCFCLVENTLEALQRIGEWNRDRHRARVVGITGSNGKTVVKEWAFQILRSDFEVVRSPKSYNSQIGVPLSLWQIDTRHDLAIIEVGISKPGEMRSQEHMVRPEIGIITNIGSAHQENFSSVRAKLNEKFQLFKRSKILIFCEDSPLISAKAHKLKNVELWGWSAQRKARIWFEELEIKKNSARFWVHGIGASFRVKIPFGDSASIENARHCVCLMAALGIEASAIARRLEALEPIQMRLALEPARHSSLLINDSYNSDLESLKIALDFFDSQRKKRRALLVISDMEQIGLKPEKWVSEIEKLLENRGLSRVVGIGAALTAHPIRSVPDFSAYPDVAAFLRAEPSFPPENSIVLFKGARTFGFEKLAEVWAVKKHQTELQIDLNAMAGQLNSVRAQLGKKVKLMAVVKASSYGAGGLEVASMLQFQKVDYLAVAYADEGIELRQSGIALPIMVMNPEEEALDRMIEFSLEPEIYSFKILELFIKALLRSNTRSEPFPIHLKIDTGMHRLGFELREMASLSAALTGQRALAVRSVFTHLAASENPEERDRTLAQLKNFDEACSVLAQQGQRPFLRHVLNSSGIVHYPDFQYEMVRLGIGLYGLDEPLEQPVLKLLTRISQIKMVRKGESIGYGYSFVAQRDMRSATIAIGYADGFDRRFSNGIGSVWIKGKSAAVVGKVCMDLCMVDVTDIDCAEGDEVEIFGAHIHVQELASRIGTIAYEILTGISPRVKRVYLQG